MKATNKYFIKFLYGMEKTKKIIDECHNELDLKAISEIYLRIYLMNKYIKLSKYKLLLSFGRDIIQVKISYQKSK